MSQGVCFFNHGTKHIARLVVAIHSLRKHYDGPVCVLHTGMADSSLAIDMIGADSALDCAIQYFAMQQLRRNSCYCAKPTIWRHSPFDRTLLVDSDTLFLRSPQPLLDMVADESRPGLLFTKFSDWRCDGRIIGGRLEKWRGVKCDGLGSINETIDRAKQLSYPAINTGVVAWASDQHTREKLELWERLTLAGWRNPWTDELAAQIIAASVRVQLADEIYNSSVLYAKDRENAAIIHAHGGKHLRPEMGGRWLAEYQECCAKNIAMIQNWGPATDSRLAGL